MNYRYHNGFPAVSALRKRSIDWASVRKFLASTQNRVSSITTGTSHRRRGRIFIRRLRVIL